ncbi:MAG: DUF1559 domain-containing protein [Capsulimonas sp.]|uniref:DUF1559 family PulG-like putative transporter n=1 Tax=Capsulimonas sp. TaxID=2494211 RepID=UPI003265EF78
MKSLRKSNSGFTLIELLVVIAIIAILAAILFPVFAKAREKARQIACLSNMKQLSLGMMQYTQYYDELLCPSFYGYAQGWGGYIYPYVKSTGVYKCPDDSTASKVAGGKTVTPVSYAMNTDLATFGASVYMPGRSLAELNSPSNTVLLFEVSNDVADVTKLDEGANFGSSSPPSGYMSASSNGFYDQMNGCYGWPGTDSCQPKNAAGTNWGGGGAQYGGPARHTDGANYAATDGHVKYLRPTQISIGNNANASTNAQNLGTRVAAGTDNMTLDSGGRAVMTFSTK